MWQWGERWVRMSNGQRWSSVRCLFLREIMEALGSIHIHVVACMCSAQSFKTVTMQVALLYWIDQDPGPTLWVTSTKDMAVKEMKGRIKPMFNDCEPVAQKMPTHRSMCTTREVYFPGGEFRITGCDSEADLQTTPYRRLVLDEARSYPKGALEMVGKRVRSFPHSFKKVIISTPDEENDALHKAYLEGTQEVWHFRCRGCAHEQELKWGEAGVRGGVKWTTNEVTKKDGRWNYPELYKTLHYECEACGYEYWDIRSNGVDRVWFATQGRWIVNNHEAPKDYRSFAWNALLPPVPSWEDQLHEMLEAISALSFGDFMPLKVWVTETDGKPWTPKMQYIGDQKILLKRCADYDPLDTWQQEVDRCMTIDVQGKGGRHFWVVIRAWSWGGWSRLLFAGKVFTYEEIDKLVAEWNVPARNVLIDSGHFAQEIYAAIMARRYQWKALKGEDASHFLVDGVRVIWKRTYVDPMAGKVVQGRRPPLLPVFLFSKSATVYMLLNMIEGEVGIWELPHKDEMSEDYKTQVTAYEVRPETDKRGIQTMRIRSKRENHLADCERMQLVFAAAKGFLAGEAAVEKPLIDVFAE